jgi:hypothetical protein
VPQQTPCSVMSAPPLSVISPPLVAVVFVIEVAGVVVRTGSVTTILSRVSSFWQLKPIIANRKMQRKVFM